MKFTQRQTAPAAQADAGPQSRPAGGSVQLRRAVSESTYDDGRQMVSPDGGDGDQTPGSKPKTAKVVLSARKGGSPFSKEFWTELNVGHCWVDIIKSDGRKDSWGYTAKDVSNFPRFAPWKSVGGRVLHPDGSRGASGTLSRDIDEDQLAKGEQWAKSQGESYNLFGFGGGHSCATFAKGFFEQASGEKAPTGMFGALIANPNDLSAAMNKQVEKDREKDPEAAAREQESAHA